MLPCQTLDSFFHATLLQGSVSYMNEYLAVNSGGYLCTNTLCAIIAAWLGASLRSQDGD
ncbi:hypothetical protein NP493_174g02005 [Ridgeia piscesae]|uniref:Uncharacterized protein n=1 Tax=Ridgeia piscesae TaxID=27915 RepID=A0AAD9P351_RIDPI|nr:hypothetical protein NP493_174g02005 [Ridgeia piscesae]